MPINNITQTISTLPEAGRRGVDVQTQFVIKQEDFQDHLQGTTVTELNTLKDQLNSRIGEINSTTTTMNGYASTASAGASTATTKAGEASTSASEALTSRNQAETFKNNASASASTASTKASEASASATSASASASTASTKASEASASATSASASASTASTKASEASASASTATTQAGISTTKASEASTQAGIATTKANEASASATSATTSRNQAETFAQQAQASAASVDANNIQTQLNAKLGIYSNATSATKLFTPRLIGGVNFDGTADINLPGVNVKGNQDTSGTAEKAKYQTAGTGTTCLEKFNNTPANSTSFSECNNVADAPNTGWWMIHSIRHSNSSNYWGTQIAYGWEGNANSIYQRNVSSGTWSAWTRVDVSGANISELVNNTGYITTEGRAYPRKVGGGAINFNWSGQAGQPNWVWGGNDSSGGVDMYVWSPSNFNVNYANTCWRANDLGNHQWSSNANIGYIRLSTGIIEQWGDVSYDFAEGTQIDVYFATTFPSVCYNVVLCPMGAASASNDNGSLELIARYTNRFTVRSNSQSHILGVSYTAKGI